MNRASAARARADRPSTTFLTRPEYTSFFGPLRSATGPPRGHIEPQPPRGKKRPRITVGRIKFPAFSPAPRHSGPEDRRDAHSSDRRRQLLAGPTRRGTFLMKTSNTDRWRGSPRLANVTESKRPDGASPPHTPRRAAPRHAALRRKLVENLCIINTGRIQAPLGLGRAPWAWAMAWARGVSIEPPLSVALPREVQAWSDAHRDALRTQRGRATLRPKRAPSLGRATGQCGGKINTKGDLRKILRIRKITELKIASSKFELKMGF